MKKITSDHGGQREITFKATKKQYTAPKIADTFIDDDGETIHVLENGNMQSKISYDAAWHPTRGKIDLNGRGHNPSKFILMLCVFCFCGCATIAPGLFGKPYGMGYWHIATKAERDSINNLKNIKHEDTVRIVSSNP